MKENLRHSKQRDAVLKLLKSVECHPSAEWIYTTLKSEYPNISLATVYRNLNLICECDDAIKIDVGDGVVRYDGRTSEHSHFICNECGKLIDIFEDIAPCDGIESKYKIEILTKSLVLRGKCDVCLGSSEA